MDGPSIKERVFAAAERVAADGVPTVAAVRAAAGVSNADATKYLRDWKAEQVAAAGQVPATPAPLAEHAARLAGAMWAEASRTAAERHAALEAAWTQEKAAAEQELAELAADLDKATEEAAAAAREAARELAAATAVAEAAGARAAEAAHAGRNCDGRPPSSLLSSPRPGQPRKPSARPTPPCWPASVPPHRGAADRPRSPPRVTG
uniref:DNA-binding protein n=1 Tax=Pigmentiphaga litoralis TaxID=516702 RepID=UPI00389AC057